MIKWSSGQKQKYVFTQIPYYAWRRWMTAKMQLKDRKVKWTNSKCLLLAKNCWNRWRTNWIRLEDSPRIFVIGDFSGIAKRNIELERFTDWIIFISMFNDIDWTRKGNEWICIWDAEKVKDARKDSRRDTGRFAVLQTKRSCMDVFFTHLKETGFKNTGHPLFQEYQCLIGEILKRKNNRDTIRFNADASNTELLFESFILWISSVFTEQFRIGVNISA